MSDCSREQSLIYFKMLAMWTDLPEIERKQYEKLILNFASLSEAFAQKEENDDSIVAPIVNSKFQETAFQKCFNAYAEDIANTSYDASINARTKKYLIGLKTFGFKSGDQKIAQFKSIAGSADWINLIDSIKKNAHGLTSKEEINNANKDLYLELAKKIAQVRNERIESSKKNLRGFKLDNVPVEAVYHVLMPSPKNEQPIISVGEISYSPIDVENIKILGCTTPQTPQNFAFTDRKHEYKWTSADSQLLMKFHNAEIVLEKWPVRYVDDAFEFFENMGRKQEVDRIESHSWRLKIEPYSGFNAFMGQPKMARKDGYREKKINHLIQAYANQLSTTQLFMLKDYLRKLLLNNWNTDDKKDCMVRLRQKMMEYVDTLNIPSLTEAVQKMAYRPNDEFELRIPSAWEFHHHYPHFFTDKKLFQPNTHKCIENKDERTFKLRFIPSGDEISAYINQDSGKAIESVGTQSTLGSWVLREVFQLKPYEPLTENRLNEMGINAVRLTKRDGAIELSFIWIDPGNLPDDIWE